MKTVGLGQFSGGRPQNVGPGNNVGVASPAPTPRQKLEEFSDGYNGHPKRREAVEF